MNWLELVSWRQQPVQFQFQSSNKNKFRTQNTNYEKYTEQETTIAMYQRCRVILCCPIRVATIEFQIHGAILLKVF
jgi:hypothetical protein